MKYTIETQEKEFEPITLIITIENLAELKSMWARMLQGIAWDDNHSTAKGAYMNTFNLWDDLDVLLNERSKENKND